MIATGYGMKIRRFHVFSVSGFSNEKRLDFEKSSPCG
jgi:hypothetical protein